MVAETRFPAVGGSQDVPFFHFSATIDSILLSNPMRSTRLYRDEYFQPREEGRSVSRSDVDQSARGTAYQDRLPPSVVCFGLDPTLNLPWLPFPFAGCKLIPQRGQRL